MQSENTNSDHGAILLREVTYLAQLASNPKEVDAILDTVRLITARNTRGTMSAQDVRELKKVYLQLEDYLIHRDPLRSFTKESLEAKVAREFDTASHGIFKRKPWLSLAAAWVACFSASGLAFLATPQLNATSRESLAGLVLLGSLYVCIPTFYLLALKDFKQELRRAYVYICIGIGLIGLSTVQYPLLQIVPPLQHNQWFGHGGFTLGYAVACCFIYAGLRLLARLLSVSSRVLSVPLVALASLVLIVVTPLVPHPVAGTRGFFFDFPIVGLALCVWFQLLFVFMSLQIANKLSPRYARALRWYAATNGLSGLGSFEFAAYLLIAGHSTSTGLAVAASPFIVSGFLMLQSGYTFYKASQDTLLTV